MAWRRANGIQGMIWALWAVMVFVTGTVPAMAGGNQAPSQGDARVALAAKLGQSVMPAGRRHTGYIRIDLTGIPLPKPEERTPVNVAIVLDRSGSMSGAKLAQAKEAAIMALDRLGPEDVVSVIAYSHVVDVIAPAMPLSERDRIEARIRAFQADGRTALYAGVKAGIAQLREYLDLTRVNRLILLSDGIANVGPSSPEALATLGREAAQEGIAITTIGLGLGYNEDLMTRLAYASDGNHSFVEHPDDLVDIFNKEFGDVLSVVAQQVEIIITFRPGFRPMRSLGREAKRADNQLRFRLNQLYGKQKKYLLVAFQADPKMARGEREVADIRITYRDMATGRRESHSTALRVGFSASRSAVRNSLDPEVMAVVAEQIAIARNEKALALRDQGDIAAARQLLKENAAYLRRAAKAYRAPALEEKAKANLQDAARLSSHEWNRTRKLMRSRQHKGKVQQSY